MIVAKNLEMHICCDQPSRGLVVLSTFCLMVWFRLLHHCRGLKCIEMAKWVEPARLLVEVKVIALRTT